MEAKSFALVIAPDLNQVRLALADCARQLRYTARNVPGSELKTAPVLPPQSSLPRPLPQFLGSVGHIADTLIETAEACAGQAIPPLQDHWKLPVDVDVDPARVMHPAAGMKWVRTYSAIYYAAAKRFILDAGARDVLIFEHRISDAFASLRDRGDKAPPAGNAIVGARADLLRDASQSFAELALALIDRQPVRSARFDALPGVVAPWWLIAEPNVYVFLLLGLLGCAKRVCPAALPAAHDDALHLVGDIVGSRESTLRDMVTGPHAGKALQQEFARVLKYL